MTQGIVLLAYNNGLDYISLAKDVAIRAHRFLELPVTIITDTEISNNLFDRVINLQDNSNNFKTFRDGPSNKKLLWKNFNRSEVYDLSPYDQTLVLDVDYVIQSNFLKNCFKLPDDLMLYNQSTHVSGKRYKEFEYISSFSIPFYWATVIFFKKTKKNETFFNYVRYVKDNWDYFRDLYQIVDNKFRNDFAFSIALHVANGFISNKLNAVIPGKLNFITDKDSLLKLEENSCTFKLANANNLDDYTVIETKNIDIHVMNKYSLLRCLT